MANNVVFAADLLYNDYICTVKRRKSLMSGRNNDDYFDLDNFDDEIYSSSSRAEKKAGKKPVPKSKRTKARERRIKMLKNRSLIIVIGIAILALVIVLFVFMINGCGGGKNKVVNVSTETKFKQEGRRATPSEADPNNKSNGNAASSDYKKPAIEDDNSPAEVYGECCVWKEAGNSRFAPDDGSVPLTANCANRNFKDISSSALVLRTSTYADFAGNVMPTGKVNVTGIFTRYRNTWQILLRTIDDIQPAP